jgi:molecular chaperone HtpG
MKTQKTTPSSGSNQNSASKTNPMKPSIFQVNLAGILKVLSDSLYSSWEVFVRELLQNANDAMVARHGQEDFEPLIQVSFFENADGRVLVVKDNGIGLKAEEMAQFLSKIGASSKSNVRDLFDREQQGFIGQFGIGLLSCFMVSDEIRVESTSLHEQKTTVWKGRIDGTYQIEEAEYNEQVGTHVRLHLKNDIELDDEKLQFLLDQYGSYLTPPIAYTYNLGEPIYFEKEFPWLSPEVGNKAVRVGKAFFEEKFTQFFPISDADGTTKGIAYILPRPTHMGAVSQHAVYVKRMFVSKKTDKVLPPWAFFVKAVLNSDNLSTTASREDIYENDILSRVREELGDSIKTYLRRLGQEYPEELIEIIRIHGIALKSLALADDAFFRFIADWLLFPTTMGYMMLRDIRKQYKKVLFIPDEDAFRQISPIAKTNGQLIINGGYIYDTSILRKLKEMEAELIVQEIDGAYFGEVLEDIDIETYDRYRKQVSQMQYCLADYQVQLDLKTFEPNQLPAMLYMSQQSQEVRDFESIKNNADDLWGDISDAMIDFEIGFRAKLYLNYANPMVQKLLLIMDPKALEPYVRMIYFNALMMGHYPMNGQELQDMNSAILNLMEKSL